MEEAGIAIDLHGLLRVEHSLAGPDRRLAVVRVTFYARPRDPTATPKQQADEESLGARYAWGRLPVGPCSVRPPARPPISHRSSTTDEHAAAADTAAGRRSPRSPLRRTRPTLRPSGAVG